MAGKKKKDNDPSPKLSSFPTEEELDNVVSSVHLPRASLDYKTEEARVDLNTYNKFSAKDFNNYSNNRVLKKRIAQEIMRCGRDPVYFLEMYGKVISLKKGLVRFKLFDYQKNLIRNLQKNGKVIVLKSRQIGISTIIAGYIAWLIFFRKNKYVVVVSKDQRSSINIIRKIKIIYDNLPKYLKITRATVNNRQSIELSNGSQVTAFARTVSAGRSEAASLVVLDEMAHIQGMGEIVKAILPTISTGGNIVMISTPGGVGNEFHRYWVEAETGENGYLPVKIHWSERPDFDQKWYEEQIRGRTEQDINQEYECKFVGSGDTVLSASDFEWLEAQCKDPIEKRFFDNNLWIWEGPIPSHKYLIACDVARGDAKDHNAFVVIDANESKIVAEYKGKIAVEEFPEIIYETGIEYNNAGVIIENLGVGLSVANDMIKLGYPNMYFTPKKNIDIKAPTKDVFHRPLFKDSRQYIYSQKYVPGFTMSYKTRPMVIGKGMEYIRLKAIGIPSKRLYNELLTFVWNNGKPAASIGQHDDLVMAWCVGAWVLDIVKFAHSRPLDKLHIMRNTIRPSDAGIQPPPAAIAPSGGRAIQDAYRIKVQQYNRIYMLKYGNEVTDWRKELGVYPEEKKKEE